MNVLSLFDGISCGQIALERAGIKVDNYFASEIDKHAIKVTQTNYPNTIQLGDVTKWREWDLPKIDLILAGSPCQGFSYAGKQLNFADPRSALFFEFVKIRNKLNPKYFLLENVRMKKEALDVISDHMGVAPILINSSLVSAQSRDRYYWTNIPNVDQPEDKGIFVKDILDSEVDNKYYLNEKYTLKSLKTNKSRLEILRECYRSNHPTFQKKPVLVSEVVGDTPSGRSRQTDRLYSHLSKLPCLTAARAGDIKVDSGVNKIEEWRTLTPVECERIQTIPDNYTLYISENQRFKCLGNGWTVDVIKHILEGIKS